MMKPMGTAWFLQSKTTTSCKTEEECVHKGDDYEEHIQGALRKRNGLWAGFCATGESVLNLGGRGKRVGGSRVKDRVMETMKGGKGGLGREVRSLWKEYFFFSVPSPWHPCFQRGETHTNTKKNTKERVNKQIIHSTKADMCKWCITAQIQPFTAFNQACGSFLMQTTTFIV